VGVVGAGDVGCVADVAADVAADVVDAVAAVAAADIGGTAGRGILCH
jgi:hypothetical protein